MFVVDLRRQEAYQKCFDPECRHYRGEPVALPEDCRPCFYDADTELLALMEGLDLSSLEKGELEATPRTELAHATPRPDSEEEQEEPHFGSAAAAAKRRSSVSRPRDASQHRSISKSNPNRRRSVSHSLEAPSPSQDRDSSNHRRRSSDRLRQKLLSRSPSYGFDEELASIMEQVARAC